MAAGSGVLAGVATQVQQAALWAPRVYLVAALLGGVGLLIGLRPARVELGPMPGVRSPGEWLACALVASCAVTFGFGLTGWRAGERLAEALAPELVGRDLQLTGCVADLPQLRRNGRAFLFKVRRAELDGQVLAVPRDVPGLISLSWYDDAASQTDDDGAPLADEPTGAGVRAGQCWRLTARLKLAHGVVNPYGFDAELWWFEQGVRAVGTVRTRQVLTLMDDHAGSPVPRWRQALRDEIFAQVPDARAAGVLAALSLGDQGAINRDDWAVFRRTGVAHLVSISGLHITMFAWLAQGLLRRAWRRSERLMLAWPTPQAARVGGVLLAWGYAVFSGWGVPAQRTVLMLAASAALRVAGVRWPWPMVLGAAAVAVLLFDPWACLQPGFWLSFMAVGLLMASDSAHDEPDGAPPPRRWFERLRAALAGGLRAQVVATFGLAPLTLVFFKQISLVGFVANVVAIPVVSFVITPLAMLGALCAPLWALGAWVVQQLVAWLNWLASWPWATWNAAAAPSWAQALGLLGAALLVTQRRWPARAAAVALVLPLLHPPIERPAPGRFELVVADIGQGTAVLIRTATHLLVYDAGPIYGLHGEGGDAGGKVLLPLLHARGERRIDVLMLSHRDTDHVGGAASLLREMPPGELLSSLEPGHALLQTAQQAGTRTTRCAAGQSWEWDGVRFDVLQPAPATPQDLAAQQAVGARAREVGRFRPNALSCVLRVSTAGQGRVLLTGDIEREQEAALVEQLGADLRADVLIVPHHGSKTSSTDAFIEAVQPRVAVIQAGYRNRYGHPAPLVAQRYHAHAVELVASPACGAYTWTGTGAGRCERHAIAHYWRTLPPQP
jgi:competence protein ComEC